VGCIQYYYLGVEKNRRTRKKKLRAEFVHREKGTLADCEAERENKEKEQNLYKERKKALTDCEAITNKIRKQRKKGRIRTKRERNIGRL
jgi:hypothetical protein